VSHRHHHQSRLTSWGRSTLQLQRSTAVPHATSAEVSVSISTCRTQVCLGRPDRRFQCGLLSGRPPARMSTASRIAIRPGASSSSQWMCPKIATRHLRMWLVRSSCSVWLVTSALVTHGTSEFWGCVAGIPWRLQTLGRAVRCRMAEREYCLDVHGQGR